tara:strand:- start:120 stop:551 length:432 start_codon:yes stop_codon:yes gene_type:complete
MAYNNKTLYKKVVVEAKKLRGLLTTKEKERLKPNTLDPVQRTGCIYGQITGNCDSERAIELIKACTVSWYNYVIDMEYDSHPPSSIKAERLFNIKGQHIYDKRNFSPIELYISTSEFMGDRVMRKSLTDYLKGKSETLLLPKN